MVSGQTLFVEVGAGGGFGGANGGVYVGSGGGASDVRTCTVIMGLASSCNPANFGRGGRPRWSWLAAGVASVSKATRVAPEARRLEATARAPRTAVGAAVVARRRPAAQAVWPALPIHNFLANSDAPANRARLVPGGADAAVVAAVAAVSSAAAGGAAATAT